MRRRADQHDCHGALQRKLAGPYGRSQPDPVRIKNINGNREALRKLFFKRYGFFFPDGCGLAFFPLSTDIDLGLFTMYRVPGWNDTERDGQRDVYTTLSCLSRQHNGHGPVPVDHRQCGGFVFSGHNM